MCALAELQKACARAAAWLPQVELRRRLVLLCTGQRARGPCSTHNNMHNNAASRDCNGIGERERTFRAQGLPCKACLPTRRFAGNAWLLRKARPQCARPACAAPIGLRAGVPEWSRVPVVRDEQPCWCGAEVPLAVSPQVFHRRRVHHRRMSARASLLTLEGH